MGGISEKLHIPINGLKQGMFLKGGDPTRPVLLFLHGGPGMPEYFLDRTHPTRLEQGFVVCWWEQRGAGLSYSRSIPPGSMTVAELVSDTLAVTDYLRERFRTDRIYLMGHSWGSFLGIQVAHLAPDRYHAYIGMGQVSYQLASERLSYEYELEQFRREGRLRMVRKLERAPVTLKTPMPTAYLKLRDRAMHSLGVGTTRGMKSVVTGIFAPVWRTREYSVSERMDIWRGKRFSRSLLWDTFVSTDLTKKVAELQIPVYFLHGKHDYTVSYPLAKTYFDQLRAPVKGFYTFDESAHSPLFEEPEKARRILRDDVVAGQTRLADDG